MHLEKGLLRALQTFAPDCMQCIDLKLWLSAFASRCASILVILFYLNLRGTRIPFSYIGFYNEQYNLKKKSERERQGGGKPQILGDWDIVWTEWKS